MLTDLIDPAKQAEITLGVNARLYDKAACFRSMNFKHENIYAFIMGADLANSTVLFNGNNFDLNGANLELDDDSLPGDDKSIAGLFIRELAGGTSAYANYRWDDPTTTEDDVPNFFERQKGPRNFMQKELYRGSEHKRADLRCRCSNSWSSCCCPCCFFT